MNLCIWAVVVTIDVTAAAVAQEANDFIKLAVYISASVVAAAAGRAFARWKPDGSARLRDEFLVGIRDK